MPTLYSRDPITGTLVPLLGGMTQDQADAKYILASGDSVIGSLTVPEPYNSNSYRDHEYDVVPKSYVDESMVGLVLPYAGATAPTGWLLCQGQAVSRTTYQRLYDICLETFGAGNGSTTFNIPDFRGRTWVGIGTSAYFNTRGEEQGVKTVTLTKAQLPNFSGQATMHNSAVRTMIYTVSGSIVSNSQPGAYATGYQNSGNPSIGGANLNMGFGGGAHSNITYSVTINYIVRT